MKSMRRFVVVGLALGVASGSLGCPEKGAMEKAGEKVDEVVDDIAHPNEGPLEEAGREIEETFDDATD